MPPTKGDEQRQKAIVNYYLSNNATLQETGDQFGITRERVRQILAAFKIKRLRAPGHPPKKNYKENPLTINDMAEISRLLGHLPIPEIARRLGKHYFTVNKACHRVEAGLSCKLEWHPCTECGGLIADPKRITHEACLPAKLARRGRERRKGPHTPSTKYVARYRKEHPEKKKEQDEKYKAYLRARYPHLPKEVKEDLLDRAHEYDLQGQELTIDLATNHGAEWSVEEELYVIEHIKTPARDVAIKLGRTLWSIKGRRRYLRKKGLID